MSQVAQGAFAVFILGHMKNVTGYSPHNLL